LLFLAVLIISITAVSTEVLIKRHEYLSEVFRKILHFTAVSLAAVIPLLLREHVLLLLVTFLSTILVIVVVSTDYLKSIRKDEEKSWGIIYFSIIYTLAIFILPAEHFNILSLSFLILAIADSLAAIAGVYFAGKTYRLSGGTKSYLGSIVFFFSTFLIALGFPLIFSEYFMQGRLPFFYLLHFAFVISIVLTTFEALASQGFDNFLIPLFSIFLSFVFLTEINSPLLLQFTLGLVLAGIVAALSYRAKFLTADGSVSTFLLAGFIFGLGGWKWSIPILTFFILSSLLSKVRKEKNAVVESYFEKSGTRDFMQVFANGGLGGVLVIINTISPSELFYYGYVASLAAVCADTWSTELGTLKVNKTYNILNFKPVSQGMSGGISIPGTLGGLAGAIVIAVSGLFFFESNMLLLVIVIVGSGFAGGLFDSILGATVQVQYKCKICGNVTENVEHCGERSQKFRGLEIINNDFVNFLSGVFGLIMFILIWSIAVL